MKCGEWSETKLADEKVSLLCKWIQKFLLPETYKMYLEFNAIEYRSQVVAGKNYIIKVQVGEDDYVHLQIFQSLVVEETIKIKFEGLEGDHKREDPLVPFKPFSQSENTT